MVTRVQVKQNLLPVAVDELPEYRDCVSWAARVRADAEKEIEDRSVHVSDATLDRIERLVGDTVSKRDLEILKLWNGVGIQGIKPGNHHSIHRLMESVSYLPACGTDLVRWWYDQVVRRGNYADSVRSINVFCLLEGFYGGDEESVLVLKRVLKAALGQMSDGAPSAVQVADLMAAEQSPGEVPLLSKIVSVVNKMAFEIYLVRSDCPDREMPEDERTSPNQVNALLVEGGFIGYEQDCGGIEGVERMRDLVKEYGRAAMRSCLSCTGWFVGRETSEWSRAHKCVGCGSYGPIHFPPRGQEPTAEDKLLQFVRRDMEADGDLSRNMALVYGISPEDADRLLTGELIALEQVERRQGKCPVAASCSTLCGVLQHKFDRGLPFTRNGQHASCLLYQFLDENESVEGDARDQAARRWLVQAETMTANQKLLRKVSLLVAEETESEGDPEVEVAAAEEQIGFQGSLL